MLIVSQNKQTITPIESGTLVIEDNTIFMTHPGIIAYSLGTYKTEERTREVVDAILEEYKRHIYGQGGTDYTVPGIVQAFGFNPPKVFEMPKE